MPEFYLEPLTDRHTCFKCEKTVKKKLLKCNGCHAITYCGVECQSADWDRHGWNCVPVMVTEFPGKGRGLVAAKDIKKGEVIFIDEPVIKLPVDAQGNLTVSGSKALKSLKEQIDNMPLEAKLQFHKLFIPESQLNFYNNYVRSTFAGASPSDRKLIKLFLSNSKLINGCENILYLNSALVNHSCAPNAIEYGLTPKTKEEELTNELRAIKDISKGEEIVTCYFPDVKKYGSISRKRKTGIKKDFLFDCKCPVCLGKVPGQEKLLKKLIEMHSKFNPTPSASDWKKEARICDGIFDLTKELYIGRLDLDKTKALDALLRTAHLARDRALVRKAMDKWRQHLEENMYEDTDERFEAFEERLAKWSTELKSNKAPEKREIDFFFGISFSDSPHLM